MRPRILLLGGVDPTGGAGLALDVRVVSRCGGHPAAVPVVLTVQDRHGLHRIEPVVGGLVEEMVAGVLADGPVAAVKVGLLGTPAAVNQVAALVEGLGVPLVVDPVLGATAGGRVLGGEVVAAYRESLLRRATLVTPNLPEAERLGGAGALLEAGAGAVLLKGGHGEGERLRDRLLTAAGVEAAVFEHAALDRGPVHGTGCALASAVTAGLARGEDLVTACRDGVGFVQRCLEGTQPATDGLPVPLEIIGG